MSEDWVKNSNANRIGIAASNLFEGDRAEYDYYATEPKAVELLCGIESFSHRIWEPACGGKHIAKVLEGNGHQVRCSDLIDRTGGTEVLDFLSVDTSNGPVWDGDIVTNPPYSCADAFIQKALDCIPQGRKVAMFLKLQFLEGKKRRLFFDRNPPIRVWVSSSRLHCYKNGDTDVPRACMVCYAWYIWEKGYEGFPTLRWFN